MKRNYTLIIAIILNLLLRIPRILYAQGADGLLLVWESKLILQGEYFTNGFNFASSLGLNPFSGYPIGSILIMSFLLLITNQHTMFSILLFDYIFSTIFIVSCYFLSKELDLKFPVNVFFLILSISIPNLIRYSYYNSSTRLPFWSLLPFLILLLLRWEDKKNPLYLLGAITLGFILNFFHRAALLLIIIFVIALILRFIRWVSKKDFLVLIHTPVEITQENNLRKIKFWNYVRQRIWIYLLLFIYTLSYIIFYVVLKIESTWESVQFDISSYIEMITDSKIILDTSQSFVDLWFNFGIVFPLLLIFLIFTATMKSNKLLESLNSNKKILSLIYFILPFIFVYRIVYSIYYLWLLFAIISAYLINYLYENNEIFLLIITIALTLLSAVFIYVYNFVLYRVGAYPYLILILFVLIVTTIVVINNKKLNTKSNIISKIKKFESQFLLLSLLSVIILNSMFIIDRHSTFFNRDGYLYTHITKEEVDIANFLLEQGQGTFDSFDPTVSVHLAALTGWFFLQDVHSRTLFLLSNKTINDYNCSLLPVTQWYKGVFYDCELKTGRELYIQLLLNDCFSPISQNILKTFNISYFVTAKNSTEVTILFSVIDSPFIASLNNLVPLAYSTEHFNIWNVSTIYN